MPSSKPLRRFDRTLAPVLNLEWLLVALAVAGSMVKTDFLPLAVVVALLFWPLRWLAKGGLSLRTPLDWPVLLLSVMLIVSLGVTASPDTTWVQVWRAFSGIALFYAFVHSVNTPGRLKALLLGMAGAGLILALSAPFSVSWSVGKLPFIPAFIYDRFVVLFTDYIHPNVLAGSLALLLPLMVAWLLFDDRNLNWPLRIGIGLAVLADLAVLALTASRGAWLSAGCALLLLVLLRWRWGWLGLLAAGLAAAFASYRLGFQAIVEFLSSNNAISGLPGRVEIWSRAIFMIRDFPFTGIGMGTFGTVADTLYPFFLNTESIPHAHNLFLQIAADLGLPGLIAWLAMLIIVIFSAWQLLRIGNRQQDLLLSAIGAGVLASMLAMIVHGMTDAVVWGMVKPAPLVWAIWGLAVAARWVDRPFEQLRA